MEKSKAYTSEKPYMCVYETKEDGIGYATFDNEQSLLELLNECRENGDKILDACKVEDRYEFKDGKFEYLLRDKEDIEKTEAKLSQRKQIVRDMLDVCYEAVWECDDRIDKMKL